MKYDFAAIEKKWQDKWEQVKPYAAVTGDKRPKFYGLIEFPYPSAAGLHVGHPRPFTAMDIICRKKRMQGYNVLNPIGFDAFGLPTENFAIKNHIHPAIVTQQNIKNFTRQLKMLGYGFDWDRVIDTTDPQYYNGRSGSSSSCSSTTLPTRRRCPSTGARAASVCWPTKRSSRACASAAAHPLSARKRASGCCASRSMPTA